MGCMRLIYNMIIIPLTTLGVAMGKKRAKNRMHPSAIRYASLVERSNDGIIIIEEGRLIYVNPRMAEMAGYTPDEALGKPFLDFVSPDSKALVADRYRRRLDGENVPDRYEAGLLRRNGTRIPIEVNSSLIEEGEKPAIMAIIRDMTERKRAEEALAESEAKHRSLFENSFDAILLTIPDGRILSANAAACRMFGRSEQEICQVGRNGLLDPTDPRLAVALEERARTGKFMGELTFVRKDGTRFTGELTSTIFLDNEGKPKTSMIIRDVSERKKAEETLKESEERYRHFIQSSHEIMQSVGKDGSILFVNKAWHDILGYSEEDIKNIKLMDIIHPDSLEHCYRLFGEVISGKSVTNIEAKFKAKDGHIVYVEGRAVPRYLGNTVIATHGFFSDITERKKAEETIRQSEEFLNNVIEQTPNAMWISDNQGTVIRMNQALRDLLKVTDQEIVGKYNVLKDRQIAKQGLAHLVESVFKEGKTVDFTIDYDTGKERQVQLAEKAYRVLNIVMSAITGKDGKVIHVICQQKDITEQKRAEEALADEAIRRRILIEQSRDGIVILDQDGAVYDSNQRFADMLGYPLEEVRRLHVWDWDSSIPREQIIAMIRSVDEKGDHFETKHRRKDGCVFDVEISTNGAIFARQKLIFCVCRDITERKRAQEKLLNSMKSAIAAIALTTEMRDPYTAGHQQRVAMLACAIADEMELPKDKIEGLRLAGIVHDIGKMHVPAEILAKPGRLSDLEFSLIKVHPQAGHDVLKDVEFPWPIAQTILQHHERLDGSGYPKGLKSEDIILEARILAVSDVVEAMVSHRPYRAAIGVEKALDEIKELRGSLYDADVVDACLRLFKEKGFKFEAGPPGPLLPKEERTEKSNVDP